MGLFSDHDDSANHHRNNTCPIPVGAEPLEIRGTGHFPMYIIAAACALITLVSSVLLILLHLTRYRAPKEQRQIIRIALVPFVFAIVSWAEIMDYSVAAYIDPIGEVYESFCLCALFLLYIQYTTPNGTLGEKMFQAMEETPDAPKQKGGSWAKTSWISVFQFPLSELLAVVILEATEANKTYCATSFKPSFGHLWVMIIRTIGVVFAVTAIFRFYKKKKQLMEVRRGMAKLLCFKGIVFLRFLQTWIFGILIKKNVLRHSDRLSFGDLVYGIPNTLLGIEMVIFSLSFWYAYSASEYSSSAKPRVPPLDFLHAVFDALNPSDLLLGIAHIFSLIGGHGYATLGGRYDGHHAGDVVEYGPVGANEQSHGSRGAEPLIQGSQEGYRYDHAMSEMACPATPPMEADPAKAYLGVAESNAMTTSPRAERLYQ
ncbi:hypothetical protein LTR08_000460 [Meristemomyces frigidus]|nr:hypothetical protein LTR08_000460 [Meristemomyces frigidus]